MKHKYLEKAGIHSYPDNHWGGVHSLKELIYSLKMKRQKRKTGVDPRDCWDMDYSFYYWLYEHLCMLVDTTHADLTYLKYNHNDREYTEIEYIEYLKSLLLQLINFDEEKNLPPIDFQVEKDSKTGFVMKHPKWTEEQRKEYREAVEKNHKEWENLRKETLDVFCELLPSLWD